MNLQPVAVCNMSATLAALASLSSSLSSQVHVVRRDCNPGLEFSIPVFGIVEFPISGSRRDWRSIVKTTKIATWVAVFGSIFELQVYDRALNLVLNADVL